MSSSFNLFYSFSLSLMWVTLLYAVICIFIHAARICQTVLPFTELETEETIHLHSEHQIRRRGQEKKIIIPGRNKLNKDENLIALISRSHRWLQELKDGQVKTISEIADNENMDDGDVAVSSSLLFSPLRLSHPFLKESNL